MTSLAAAALSFLASAVGVGLMVRYARSAGVLAIPNHRSSHSTPTPTGGGLALVLDLVCVGLYTGWSTQARHMVPFGIVVVLGIALMLIGWQDDRASASITLRLAIQVACGVGIAGLVNSIYPMPAAVNLVWLALWIFWTTASINILNFMDGIDGMIAAQGIVYGLFLFILVPGNTTAGRLGVILAAACAGFLVWNWHPARIFMGDVGSAPLGLAMVLGGALALEKASVLLVFLPLFPMFLDALLTIILRLRRHESLWESHRSHLYQRIANSGIGHAPVSLAYAIIAAVGAGASIAASRVGARAAFAIVIIYCSFVFASWWAADNYVIARKKG